MLAQAIADGILTGAMIALGAIGVSLGLQILRFANFAHSELMTWGAYLALVFVSFAGAGALDRAVLVRLAAHRGAGARGCARPACWPCWSTGWSSGACARAVRTSLTLVFASFGAALIMRHVVVLIWGHGTHFYSRELQMARRGAAGRAGAARPDLHPRVSRSPWCWRCTSS